MTPVGLPVVVRVKRKRDLDPVDTIVVEADETPAAKRRARDAALAAELDAVLEGGLAGGPDGSKDAGARGRCGAREKCGRFVFSTELIYGLSV